jgi:hypothetical protein
VIQHNTRVQYNTEHAAGSEVGKPGKVRSYASINQTHLFSSRRRVSKDEHERAKLTSSLTLSFMTSSGWKRVVAACMSASFVSVLCRAPRNSDVNLSNAPLVVSPLLLRSLSALPGTRHALVLLGTILPYKSVCCNMDCPVFTRVCSFN